jgi:DNA-binding transcriptional regulator YiaG
VSVAVKDRPVRTQALKKKREELLTKVQKLNEEIQQAENRFGESKKVTLGKLRSGLGWSRNQMARVMNASDRAIVNWEAGEPISPVYAAKLREIESVCGELKQVMKEEEIGPWLLTETDEFDGRTPADLISRGETGRIWASLFYLRSGMPD